eukprot:s526_g7.t1
MCTRFKLGAVAAILGDGSVAPGSLCQGREVSFGAQEAQHLPGPLIPATTPLVPQQSLPLATWAWQARDASPDRQGAARSFPAPVPVETPKGSARGASNSPASRVWPVRTMSIDVEVGLISRRKATVRAALDETVGTLKRRAQDALGVGTGRLLDSSGCVLEGCLPIKRARVQNGDALTLLRTNRVQVRASCSAFAVILDDGSVVTWGDAENGGDSSAVQDQLKNVQQIQASGRAFAAILDDGSVVTWGAADSGGDSSAVQDQLKAVQQIRASRYGAFAAILDDGFVVTWGDAEYGGDSSAVQGQLKYVQQIQACAGAFAAILGDGCVVTWGHAGDGGDSRAVQNQLRHVQQLQATMSAFAAILDDGTVVTWGGAHSGGDSSAVQDRLKDVQRIQASSDAFAAILDDGSVVSWGSADLGGDSSAVQDQLRHVQQIHATMSAFAAILADGSVVTWGAAEFGGDSSAVQVQLKNVQQIQAGWGAFAAILDDGSVVTWGDAEYGGDSRAVQGQLRNVQQVQASAGAFAAMLRDGSLVSWGHAELRFGDGSPAAKVLGGNSGLSPRSRIEAIYSWTPAQARALEEPVREGYTLGRSRLVPGGYAAPDRSPSSSPSQSARARLLSPPRAEQSQPTFFPSSPRAYPPVEANPNLTPALNFSLGRPQVTFEMPRNLAPW